MPLVHETDIRPVQRARAGEQVAPIDELGCRCADLGHCTTELEMTRHTLTGIGCPKRRVIYTEAQDFRHDMSCADERQIFA